MFCEKCKKRDMCVNLCPRVEKYANSDYVSLREIPIENHILIHLLERHLEEESKPVIDRHSQLRPYLKKRMKKLTRQQKKVIRLYFYEELTLSEIAGRLGISRQAASKRLKSAMKHLYPNPSFRRIQGKQISKKSG